jgi:glutamine cyclotransferase
VLALAGACVGGDESATGSATSSSSTPSSAAASDTPVLEVDVLRTVPHRTDAFTQGLVWDDGTLYESTGRVGRSDLATIDPATGDVSKVVGSDASVFGEGLALVDDRLIQLTWKDEVAFVYDAGTFMVVDRHRYEGEGWGLCHDGEWLVMSDGSAELTFRDPETFEETGTVAVVLDGRPVERLNELECVGDRVYANIWQTDTIVEIDPASGVVRSVIDASALKGRLDPPVTGADAVLNGIAHDPDAGTFWLTGKLWPQMFEVRFVEA